MPDHLIRLRGGWELHDPDVANPEPTRLTLPVEWEPRPIVRRLRLVRKFGGLKLGPARLALEAVEGLRSMSLNGDTLPFDVAEFGRLVVELPALRERNELILDVEITSDASSAAPARPWGRIALMIAE